MMQECEINYCGMWIAEYSIEDWGLRSAECGVRIELRVVLIPHSAIPNPHWLVPHSAFRNPQLNGWFKFEVRK